MILAVLEVELRLAWCHSLKDKRGEVKSLLDRARRRFNVTAAESGRQDERQAAQLTLAALAANAAQADSILAGLERFVLGGTDAEVLRTGRQLLRL